MADFNKVDGQSGPAETFSGDLEFVTITVGTLTVRSDGTPGIDSAGVPNDLQQFLFDKIVEVVNQVAQPIVLTGGTTGETVINMIVEHNSVWSESPNTTTGPSLAADLLAMSDAFADDAGGGSFCFLPSP